MPVGEPIHDAQLMMKRTPWFAAGGGLLGALIALLIIWWLCGCPCAAG